MSIPLQVSSDRKRQLVLHTAPMNSAARRRVISDIGQRGLVDVSAFRTHLPMMHSPTLLIQIPNGPPPVICMLVFVPHALHALHAHLRSTYPLRFSRQINYDLPNSVNSDINPLQGGLRLLTCGHCVSSAPCSIGETLVA